MGNEGRRSGDLSLDEMPIHAHFYDPARHATAKLLSVKPFCSKDKTNESVIAEPTMTIDNQKEHFSYAYARAIAATAAVSVATPEVDDDSIDLILSQKATGTVYRSPRLELQVKCAEEGSVNVTATHIHYPLKLKNYTELSAADVLVPRILLVVLVPNGLGQWLNWSAQELAMRRAGYWMSLRGMAATTNTTNVTVHVPLANQFSDAQLTAMMQRIGEGLLP